MNYWITAEKCAKLIVETLCLALTLFHPFPKPTIFRLFQRFLQTTISNLMKKAESFPNGRKRCGKRRNCPLWAISSFPTVFSKDFYCRHIKTRACLRGVKYDENDGEFSKKGRKRGKGKNCSLWAISSFSTVFSKDLYCRHVKTRACLSKIKLCPNWKQLHRTN